MVSQKQVDILVLGATGFTGKLIVKYLKDHPGRSTFSLGIAGRSLQKLQMLHKELSLSSDIATFGFDISNYSEVEGVVKSAKVIINCIGPFWKWSTPIVQACAENGIHYVDITGEPWWIKELINKFDFEASQSKAIIIPASGVDSIPSDLAVYLSVRALKKKSEAATIGQSTTAITFPDLGISGGTLSTMISCIEDVPHEKLRGMRALHWLSPVRAKKGPFRFIFKLPFVGIYGGVSPMQAINQKIVYRTWGLLEARALSTTHVHKDSQAIRYGPNFRYDECKQTGSQFTAFLWTLGLLSSMAAIMLLPPVRWFLKRFGPQPGSGPTLQNDGHLTYINVTSIDGPRPEHVQTTVKFKGSTYSATATLCAEAALTILFDHDRLSDMGKEGGILTSMSALGDSLVKRLLGSGHVTYESKALYPNDSRKTA